MLNEESLGKPSEFRIRKEKLYKLTVKIPIKSKRYLRILKTRLGYKSLDRLVSDIIDEKMSQMFSQNIYGKESDDETL